MALPKASGSTPEASGSSVPEKPTLLRLKVLFTTFKALLELIPEGLFNETQPPEYLFSSEIFPIYLLISLETFSEARIFSILSISLMESS